MFFWDLERLIGVNQSRTAKLTGAVRRPVQRQTVSKPSAEGLAPFPAIARLHGNYAFQVALLVSTLPT
jgi:hypothetical protein